MNCCARSADVSLIILSCGHWDYTERLLHSLLRTEGIAFETVLVDNGSDEAVRDQIRGVLDSELGRRLRLRAAFSATNRGIATGRNAGAALAGGPLLLFLDNDVEVFESHWLSALVDAYGQGCLYGVVGSVLVGADDTDRGLFCGGTVGPDGRVQLNTAIGTDLRGREVVSSDFCLGASFLTGRGLWDRLGGFDSQYDPMDYEDVDFCLRAHRLGLQSGVVRRSRLRHWGHVTTGTRGFARLQTYLVSGRRFVKRWGRSNPIG